MSARLVGPTARRSYRRACIEDHGEILRSRVPDLANSPREPGPGGEQRWHERSAALRLGQADEKTSGGRGKPPKTSYALDEKTWGRYVHVNGGQSLHLISLLLQFAVLL